MQNTNKFKIFYKFVSIYSLFLRKLEGNKVAIRLNAVNLNYFVYKSRNVFFYF